MMIKNPNQVLMIIAAVTLSVGYIITLLTLAILVLILHDGQATESVVSSLTTMSYTGLGALTTIVLGHSIVSRNIVQDKSHDGIS